MTEAYPDTTSTSTPTTRTPPPRRTWRQWWWHLSRTTKILIFLFFTINFFIALAFIVLGKSRINEFFNDMGKKLRDMGPMGALIPCTAVILTSHPPLIGFSASMTLIGYAWGIWPGLLIGSIASQVGGWFAWLSIKTFFLKWMRSEGSRKNKHWEAFGHVIRERGLILVIMIRWCPIPYAFGNGLFAAIDGVKFWQYAVANLSFLPRLAIPVFIGSRLRSLGHESPDPARFWINLGSILVALGCGITTGVFIYRRTLAQLHQIDHDGHHDGDVVADALESGQLLGGYRDDDESIGYSSVAEERAPTAQ